MKRKKKISQGIIHILLILFSIISLFPLYWLITTSLKPSLDVFSVDMLGFFKPSLENYETVLMKDQYPKYLLNSVITSLSTVAITMPIGSMAGYAFAKLKFRGKKLLFGIVLVQMSLPSQIFIIPQYQMVAKMGMANTIFALVFPGLVSAFGVFFLRQAYMSIPDEVGEAAYLDGCNQWQTFYKIMFPLTGTSVAALTIFTAVFAYGDLMWPLVVNSDLKMMTLSSGLSTLRGQFTTNFPVLMAGSLLAMLPMVVLYLIFQRQFVEGIAGTGGK